MNTTHTHRVNNDKHHPHRARHHEQSMTTTMVLLKDHSTSHPEDTSYPIPPPPIRPVLSAPPATRGCTGVRNQDSRALALFARPDHGQPHSAYCTVLRSALHRGSHRDGPTAPLARPSQQPCRSRTLIGTFCRAPERRDLRPAKRLLVQSTRAAS